VAAIVLTHLIAVQGIENCIEVLIRTPVAPVIGSHVAVAGSKSFNQILSTVY
jgi:hypothetical protein